MATHLEHLLQKFQAAEIKARELIQKDYTADDVKGIVISCGSELEIFLKLSAFPHRSQRRTFCQFIDELLTVGISQEDIDVFHELRDAYNDSKHDPGHYPKLLETQSLINRVRNSLVKLEHFSFGQVNEQVPLSFRRVLWFFAWDHFIGGDTEISIAIPSVNNELPPPLDDIYIHGSSWDTVKSELAAIGTVSFGKELFPQPIYDFFSNEGDFLAGGVFEGDYKDFLKTLARHERRQDLLPGLNRHDSPSSMLQACILALVEVAPTFAIEPSLSILQSTLTDTAVNNFAVPAEYSRLKSFVEPLSVLLNQLDFSLWKAISGPTWTSTSVFSDSRSEALAFDESLGVLIDKNGIVRIRTR